MWMLLALIGCKGGGDEKEAGILPVPTTPSDVTTGGTPSTTAVQGVADRFWASDRVVAIDIVMTEADAAALSAQTNDIYDLLLGEECMSEPWNGPFTWFPADLTIDGTPLPESGIRKKGLIGSLSTEKPSLKVELDEYVDGQEYQGLEHLTLNNAISDPSLVKQCLGYWLFAEAGLPAPRCGYADVSGAGDPLGVYVNLEPPKKIMLRNVFGEDDGDFYEGTLSDFRAGWTETFEADTDESDASLGPVYALTAALEIADEDAMLDAVGALVDLPEFYRFWAMEVLIGHLDGYAGNTNNFYVYFPADGGPGSFVPWGIDSTFILYDDGTLSTLGVVMANSQLTRRLWQTDAGRDGYLAALDDLFATVWDEDAILAEIDRMAALVEPHALPDDYRAQAQEQLRDFVRGREAHLRAAMEADLPELEEPLPAPPCLGEVGTLRVDFDAEWGTLASPDPLSEGSSTQAGDLYGDPFSIVGAVVIGEDYGYTVLAAVALTSPTVVLETVLYIPTWQVVPGEIELDPFSQPAYLIEIDFAVSEEGVPLGMLWEGRLVLEEVDFTPGGRVRGYLEGSLVL